MVHGDFLSVAGTCFVMALDANAHYISGTYFYLKYRHDIELNGSQHGNDYQLKEGDPDSDTGGCLVFHRNGNQITGSYTSMEGKSSPISLIQLKNDDYDRLRIAGLCMVKGKRETIDGKYVVQWYREPLSGIKLFRLVSGYPASVMARINRDLKT